MIAGLLRNSYDAVLSMAPKPSAVPFMNLLLLVDCLFCYKEALSLGPWEAASGSFSQLLMLSSSEQ